MVDTSRGEAVGISFWETEEAMRASGSDHGLQHFEVALYTMA